MLSSVKNLLHDDEKGEDKVKIFQEFHQMEQGKFIIGKTVSEVDGSAKKNIEKVR